MTYGTRQEPSSATKEHVIARVLGGADTRDNIELACRLCNNMRGHAVWTPWHIHHGDRSKMTDHQMGSRFKGDLNTKSVEDLVPGDINLPHLFKTQAAPGLQVCPRCALGYPHLSKNGVCKKCYQDIKRLTAPVLKRERKKEASEHLAPRILPEDLDVRVPTLGERYADWNTAEPSYSN